MRRGKKHSGRPGVFCETESVSLKNRWHFSDRTVADLPLVLEFLDHQDKVCAVLEDLKPLIESGHLVSWPIEIHF